MSFSSLNAAAEVVADQHSRLITCPVKDLTLHPILARLKIVPSASHQSLAIKQREQGVEELLTITDKHYILAGYARWELARREHEEVLSCVQLAMTDEEALLWLIQKHQRADGLNAYNRILLALELEPWFRAKATANQKRGGYFKGSSKLTEADRCDVRAEVAAAAGVSTGNVAKTKQLLSEAHSDIIEALQAGKLSIHRAYTWMKDPDSQLQRLQLHQNLSEIRRSIDQLQSKHLVPKTTADLLDVARIAEALLRLPDRGRTSVLVGQLNHPGHAIVVSSSLLALLEHQGRTYVLTRREPIKQILELTRSQWDVPSERVGVRESLGKVLLCRTPKLGGEVYGSASEEKVFYHTCKSRACPSCGNRGTLLWRREQWTALPDIPFVGIVLTMPDVLWPVFRIHRDLQHDLPALGAAVIQQWARRKYKAELCVMVIQHTFGGRLNHNPHLHMMVSAGGLRPASTDWVQSLDFSQEEIMSLWRLAVIEYLACAVRKHLMPLSQSQPEFNEVLLKQGQRWWNIYITSAMPKRQFLGYAGRYIRRLPISQRRILRVTGDEVVYESKDTRKRSHITESRSPAEFISLLSQHIPDRYRHSMRYFGLLSPRTKANVRAALFSVLGQRMRPKPKREGWAESIRKHFGQNPLFDSQGTRMRWRASLRPHS